MGVAYRYFVPTKKTALKKPVEKKYKRKIAKYQNGTRRDRIAMKGEESANKMINKKINK